MVAQVLVFFTTANLTALHSELFQAMQIPVLEIHSRKSQPARIKAAEAFRNARQAIMFTSDVSARGVDYPDVSLVIQARLSSPGCSVTDLLAVEMCATFSSMWMLEAPSVTAAYCCSVPRSVLHGLCIRAILQLTYLSFFTCPQQPGQQFDLAVAQC